MIHTVVLCHICNYSMYCSKTEISINQQIRCRAVGWSLQLVWNQLYMVMCRNCLQFTEITPIPVISND